MVGLNYILCGILIFTTLVILFIAFFTWKRRKTKGGMQFFFMCICLSFYTFGYGMELIATSIRGVDFWSKIQYFGLSYLPSISFFMAYSLTVKNKKMPIFLKAFLIIFPTLTLLFRLTNDYHQLMYIDMKMVYNGYFHVLNFKRGVWYYMQASYLIISFLTSTVMYYRGIAKSKGYMHIQIKVMFTSTLFPYVIVFFNLFDIVPLQMDSGPFITFFIYIIFAYGIFRYDMMHIIPLSREKVFDWIYDGAIVVDADMNLEDFNYSAKKIFNTIDKSFIGKSMELITRECPDFLVQLTDWLEKNIMKTEKSEESQQEDVFEFKMKLTEEKERYYNARPMGLYDKVNLVGTIVLITDISKEKEMLQELERIARFDDLTGIFNRRYFIELVNREFSSLVKLSDNGVMVMFDIDYFKQINDTYGHLAGDFILKELALIASKLIRSNDLLGRYGGEEYIAFLPGVSIEQAKIVVERIRSAFENHEFIYNENVIKVTASFGLTEYYKKESGTYCSFDEILKNVDAGLYQAKNNGRNQVIAF